MLSQLLVSLVSLLDIAMVGRLGPTAQAAVGYATQLYFLMQSLFFAIGFACIARMATAIGSRNLRQARASLASSLALAFGISIVVSCLILYSPETLLNMLGAKSEVIQLCVPYLNFLMLSSIILSICLTIESGLRADRNTQIPMKIALVVTATKILFNFLLIFGLAGFPRLELLGAGISSLTAQVLALLLFGMTINRAPSGSALALRKNDFTGIGKEFRSLIQIAIPSVLERIILNLGLLIFFAVLGQYGTIAIATWTVGIRVLSFSWIPGIAYAQSVAALVGQALGANKPRHAERVGWAAVRLALITAIILGSFGIIFRDLTAAVFTSDERMLTYLIPLMITLCLSQPLLQVHFTLAGAHRGAGDTWTPLIASLAGSWGVRVSLGLILGVWLELPLIWIWGILFLDHGLRCLWMIIAFRKRSWLQNVH